MTYHWNGRKKDIAIDGGSDGVDGCMDTCMREGGKNRKEISGRVYIGP